MGETALPRERRRGLLAVGLVFLLGVVCGLALGFAGARLTASRFPPPGFGRGDRWNVNVRHSPLERLTERLDLDERQQAEVDAILERSRGRIRGIVEESRGEIRSLLRADQQERFDRLRPLRGHDGRGHRGGLPPER